MKTLITAMNGLPDGFAIINKDGKIIYWNPSLEKITGFKSEEATAKLVWEIQAQLMPSVYNGDYLESQKRFWLSSKSEMLLEAKMEKHSELSFVKKGGDAVSVSLKYYTTKVNRRKTFLCVVVRDLTEQKRKEFLLENLGKSANHEIKNRLNGVIGFAELLLDDAEYGLPETARPYVQIIKESGKRACAVAEKSLLLDRLELGNFSIPKEAVDLSAFISELAKDVPQIEQTYSAKIEILPDLGILAKTGNPIIFQAEKDLLRSILDNLIINAAEAAPQENKKISLTIHVNESLTFMVRNFGEIPQEIRPRLFQKYATFGKPEGNGLDLYLSKLIAEAHGGKISYSSDNGATFFVVQIPLK